MALGSSTSGVARALPTAQRLAESFAVTGVDISARQIEAARAVVPSGRFIVGDMTSVEFRSEERRVGKECRL